MYISDKTKLSAPSFRNLALSQKNRIETVFNIAALEGSPYTYPEVQTLLEGVTVGGHKLEDQQLILNQNQSWLELFTAIHKKEFKLTKEFICGLHATVAKEEALEWGTFRTSQVRISGTDYIPPSADELDDLFNQLIIDIALLHPIDQAINYFLLASRAQFFFDGNKRTSRLIANGILLQSGYYIMDIPARCRLQFNELMIDFYNTGNKKPIGDFLVEVIERRI